MHRLSLLALPVLLLTACEKVITPPLRSAASQLVIEGTLADDNQPALVRLSRSVSYAETNTFPAVSGATVTLRDDAGGQETLRETAPGQYGGGALRGVPGRRYTLRVVVDGQPYEAAATLPAPVVPFDALSTSTSSAALQTTIQAVAGYQDPAGRPNYYLFRQYRNGRLNPALFAQDDRFTDGQRVSYVLRTGPGALADDQLAAGDSLRVDMFNLDPGAYEYFRTLVLITQSNPLLSATPANPTSNFSGGCLGYFSAHSRRVRRVRVP